MYKICIKFPSSVSNYLFAEKINLIATFPSRRPRNEILLAYQRQPEVSLCIGVGEIKESLAFPKAIGEVKGWGLRKIRGWQRMLSRGKERGQGRNQYVLTVWNAFQLVSRRDKIKNSPFCEPLLSFRSRRSSPEKSPFLRIAITLQIANFQSESNATVNGWKSFSLVKSPRRRFKSFRNFLILQW